MLYTPLLAMFLMVLCVKGTDIASSAGLIETNRTALNKAETLREDVPVTDTLSSDMQAKYCPSCFGSEANAAYEATRRRTFELMQQQLGPVQYDSFIGCPIDLFHDRNGPPQIDSNNPPPPTTIAQAIQRKISQMVDGTKNGVAPN